MSSVLTNTSAMVALQTMKSVNAGLSRTQAEISTGKSVNNAKDNAAVWAISKVMESDVKSFKGISDSLSLGSSTIAVARQASETVTDLLSEMKTKIVAAQEPNVDRAKIQTDIAALRDTISTIVSTAQFNGLNLVNGSQTNVSVLASLDRGGGSVVASSISVAAQNLSTGGYVANNVFSATTGGTLSAAGDTFVLSLDATSGTGAITLGTGTAPWAAGDTVTMRLGDRTASYTVTAADVTSGNNTVQDLVAVGMKNAIDSLGISGLTVDFSSANPGQLTFANTGTRDLAVSGQFRNANSGGLGALAGINVSTASGAQQALASIEGLMQTAINASSAFGSVEKRITIQSEFVSKLTDSLKAGIGTLVDADMEEASARLQALQVQQQLSTQALSIANQQPQNLLALFR